MLKAAWADHRTWSPAPSTGRHECPAFAYAPVTLDLKANDCEPRLKLGLGTFVRGAVTTRERGEAPHAFSTGSVGGSAVFFNGRFQQPPSLNCCHAHFSQRISAAASQSAHASIISR